MIKVRTNGAAYKYEFEFQKAIKVSQQGDYILSFYSLFNCQKAGCETVGDKIIIKMKTTYFGTYTELYSIGSDNGRYNDSRWIKDEVVVKISSAEIYVRGFYEFFKTILYIILIITFKVRYRI